MKLQFKLMSLALIVFASNVQAVISMTDVMKKAADLRDEVFLPLAMNRFTARPARFAYENPKTSAVRVAVPVASLVALYKLNKAGKLESIKANAKQAVRNVGSWINDHRKTTAAVVSLALMTAYGYRDLGMNVDAQDMPSASRRLMAAPIQAIIQAAKCVTTVKSDSYIKQLRNLVLDI